jgi:hypothetical protein
MARFVRTAPAVAWSPGSRDWTNIVRLGRPKVQRYVAARAPNLPGGPSGQAVAISRSIQRQMTSTA